MAYGFRTITRTLRSANGCRQNHDFHAQRSKTFVLSISRPKQILTERIYRTLCLDGPGTPKFLRFGVVATPLRTVARIALVMNKLARQLLVTRLPEKPHRPTPVIVPARTALY